MIRRLLSALAAAAVTAAVLWLLLSPAVVEALRASLGRANWPALAAALALTGCVQWLRAWRFSVALTGRLRLPEAPLIRIALQLNMLNVLLPFRLGELSFPVMMRRTYGCGVLHATGVLLLARMFDLCAVGAILLGTAAALDLAGGAGPLLLAGAAAGLALTPMVLIAAGGAMRSLVPRIAGIGGTMDRLALGLDAMAQAPARAAAVVLSFAIWLSFGAAAVLVAAAVTDAVPPLAAMLGAAAGNLAFALPINGLAGLGPAQAAWVAAVTRAGVPWEDAVVSALLLHAVVLVGAVLFGTAALLWGNRKTAALPAKAP